MTKLIPDSDPITEILSIHTPDEKIKQTLNLQSEMPMKNK